ncbi:hypothetical protein PG301_16900 [Parageobacillus sp. G301]|nr:hypothetical protein PG301_16900 [Parageobacillus sp. G301]
MLMQELQKMIACQKRTYSTNYNYCNKNTSIVTFLLHVSTDIISDR